MLCKMLCRSFAATALGAGCGARLVRDATRLDSDLLRESRLCCHSRHINLMPRA
jgi:hypothetical protein